MKTDADIQAEVVVAREMLIASTGQNWHLIEEDLEMWGGRGALAVIRCQETPDRYLLKREVQNEGSPGTHITWTACSGDIFWNSAATATLLIQAEGFGQWFDTEVWPHKTRGKKSWRAEKPESPFSGLFRGVSRVCRALFPAT